ncbi:unnamed protein product [Schistosoma mattheei]|uniref:Uncharacterized protein n=1 Tax=Schistosoma mattheei TaxID=31246 RepID=A0A3P8GLM6_9TREM|nr:unnamed protein product [Schistosoma mattheei]
MPLLGENSLMRLPVSPSTPGLIHMVIPAAIGLEAERLRHMRRWWEIRLYF